jgi:hypothetical protein
MMSTATPAPNAAAAPAPEPSHQPRVTVARAMTAGTNTPATRSASRWTCALPFWASVTSLAIWASWASVTSLAIWASWASAPTRVARTTRRPPVLTVAPTTA